MTIQILALGDIVGPRAVEYIRRNLWGIRDRYGIALVVANGENACTGNGIDSHTADTLLSAGVDVITSGNHIWHKREIFDYLDDNAHIVRPANYKSTNPGKGHTIVSCDGVRFLVVNVMGVVYMDALENPFVSVSRILDRCAGEYDAAILDIHAEATSEKLALAHYFDGRIQVIFGTHTHVTTADEQILSHGSGYITDLGMCGPTQSVLGVRPDLIIERMNAHMPVRFELAATPIEANGTLFALDSETMSVQSVMRIKF